MLSDAVETKALLVPARAFTPDTYAVSIALDRERYRAATPNDDSRYRASTTLHLRL